MRSLSTKLTLAFVAVGLAGILLVAWVTAFRTRIAFDRFLLLSQETLVSRLVSYYELNGSWVGVDQQAEIREIAGRLPVALVDDKQQLVFGAPPGRLRTLTAEQFGNGQPILVDDEEVGRLFLIDSVWAQRGRPQASRLASPESQFVRTLNRTLMFSASGAVLLALLAGSLLAQSLTKPIREMTDASHKIAAGNLDVQVPIRSKDELGELATAFNKMSGDLSQAEQARLQMTSDIAHDLRTPVTVILGYTESLRDGILPATPEAFDVMHSEAEQLSHLIADLRTLSLADAGQLKLNKRLVAARELLAHTQAAFAPLAEQREVTILMAAANELPLLDADADQIERALANLMDNALRYTPRGGRIVLSAENDQPNRISLRVADSGPGIDAEHLPYVFDRSYRADQSRTGGQSGLGLAIVKSIVEAHGGSVGVRSDRGAVFTLTLPIS